MKTATFCITLLFSKLLFADTLTVFTWDDYLSQEVISAWETKTGHRLKLLYFDNDKERDAIIAGQTIKSIDIALLDQHAALYMGKEGLLIPSPSTDEIPNLNHIDQQWQNSCGEHAIPYLWGTLGVAYRSDKLRSAPTSWNELLEPKDELKGHVGLFEDYTDLLAPALFLDQQPANTSDKAALSSAFQRLKKTIPHLLTMSYPITFMNAHPDSDELYMTLAYSGDQFTLNEVTNSDVWLYTTLKEGTITWIDCLAVLKNSDRQALAFEFLEFLYEPNNAAINSENLYVATPISAAKALQSEEFQTDTSVYPPLSLDKHAEQYQPLKLENIELRNRITSALVKHYDSQ